MLTKANDMKNLNIIKVNKFRENGIVLSSETTLDRVVLAMNYNFNTFRAQAVDHLQKNGHNVIGVSGGKGDISYIICEANERNEFTPLKK